MFQPHVVEKLMAEIRMYRVLGDQPNIVRCTMAALRLIAEFGLSGKDGMLELVHVLAVWSDRDGEISEDMLRLTHNCLVVFEKSTDWNVCTAIVGMTCNFLMRQRDPPTPTAAIIANHLVRRFNRGDPSVDDNVLQLCVLAPILDPYLRQALWDRCVDKLATRKTRHPPPCADGLPYLVPYVDWTDALLGGSLMETQICHQVRMALNNMILESRTPQQAEAVFKSGLAVHVFSFRPCTRPIELFGRLLALARSYPALTHYLPSYSLANHFSPNPSLRPVEHAETAADALLRLKITYQTAPLCIALRGLSLAANQLVAIVNASIPNDQPLHVIWRTVVKVKHYKSA